MNIAQTYMRGQRKGSDRAAWEHPHDVVKEMKTAPWWPHAKAFPYDEDVLVAGAWLHDILEDGEHQDGTAVHIADIFEGLQNAAMNDPGGPRKLVKTVQVIEALTCKDDTPEGKVKYLQNLLAAPAEAKVIKALDRIVNLREGIRTFSVDWHGRYSRKTWDSFIPVLGTVPPPWGPWLMHNLLHEMPFDRYEMTREG
jgi:(p)ppGpp synthase/HD superfamily hydrolase